MMTDRELSAVFDGLRLRTRELYLDRSRDIGLLFDQGRHRKRGSRVLKGLVRKIFDVGGNRAAL
jgi:hypothetical protein